VPPPAFSFSARAITVFYHFFKNAKKSGSKVICGIYDLYNEIRSYRDEWGQMVLHNLLVWRPLSSIFKSKKKGIAGL